jgi:RNA recognition motif-containing protein
LNIYVGNLSYQVTEADLRSAFESYGHASSATVIQDRDTNRSKGFGLVEMPRQAHAEAAIKPLNGTDLQGRSVTVNEARPKTDAPRRDGFRRNEGFGGRQQRY